MSLQRLYTAGMLSCILLTLCAFLSSDEPPQTPIMLDNIHYYMNDAKAAREFFIKHFQAQPLAKPEKNPLPFVEYLEVRPEQASIAISPRGPFQGMHMQDPARWKRQSIHMTPQTPPAYGVHWLALRTESLKYALRSLEEQGVKIAQYEVTIPGEPMTKAAVVWGPEHTRILIVQRHREHNKETLYGIDHLLILVDNLAENIKFFQDVYAGKIQKRDSDFCRMTVGEHTIILATPGAISIPATTVQRLDSTQFRAGIEQLSFLYNNPQPAYLAAAVKGYEFSLRPSRLIYRNKPTSYVTAVTRSPEGIYCEMLAEDGREGPRTVYLKNDSPSISGNKKDK
jgi:hypothetical protein